MSKKTYDICSKIVATINYLVTPLAAIITGVAAVWGFSIDWSLYIGAFAGVINSVWEFVKLFVKAPSKTTKSK